MAGSIEPLARLVAVLSELPGVGKRSAERMALYLARNASSTSRDLAHALQEVVEQIGECERCGNITQKKVMPCALCTDPRRDGHQLCVVEDPGDIRVMERTHAFKGRYHALMGKISPMRGEGIQNLRVQSLLKRLREEEVTEVVLALNSDVESDATASFLHEVLAGEKVKVTRLAFGLPAGSGIAYSDAVTLARALDGRQELQGG